MCAKPNRSAQVRVFKRLAASDRQLRCGMAAENTVRGHANRDGSAYGPSGAEAIVR